MSIEVIALLTLAALFAGTVDAIAGGGGLVTVPAFLAAGLPADLALGTNKGQSVWGSLAATIAFWRAGRIDRRLAMWSFPLAVLGGTIGSRLLLLVSNEVLRPVVLAVKKPTGTEHSPRRPAVFLIAALVLGTYDGFFGPGVGTFLIVTFVSWCGRTLVDASADAKVINFGSNVGALVTLALADRVEWRVALPMAVAQLCGGMLGAHVTMAGGARLVRIVVLCVSGALVARIAYQLIAG